MIFIAGLMTLTVIGLIVLGVILEFAPQAKRDASPRMKAVVIGNLALFAGALAGLMILGVQDVMAEPVALAVRGEISVGMGLAIIGVGLPTAIAALAAALALGPVGSAALAVIAEKPELFGRTLIYLGLAEGIAIYGLVMSILLLGKL
jgi:V/A-type H+-transporting ATPase subunit K